MQDGQSIDPYHNGYYTPPQFSTLPAPIPEGLPYGSNSAGAFAAGAVGAAQAAQPPRTMADQAAALAAMMDNREPQGVTRQKDIYGRTVSYGGH
jgi:hypothetical protein